MQTEARKLAELRPHPENAKLFDTPDECDDYEQLRDSIKKYGLWEPVIIKEDGTILSGHLRAAAMRELGHDDIRCRVMSFPTYRAEVTFVVRSNTDRRQLKKSQIARAFEILKRLPKEQGGVKRKHGGDRKSKKPGKDSDQPAASGALNRDTRDAAAEAVKIGRHEAEALSTVFNAPKESKDQVEVKPAADVPDEVQQAVEQGKVAPTTAAKQIKAERKRQGGEIKDPEPIKAWVGEKASPKPHAEPSKDEVIEREVAAFNRDMAALVEVYKRIDQLLSHRPLLKVEGPSEHQRYAGIISDIAIRCAREIESVTTSENVGRQISLMVLQGGKS